MTRSNKAHKCLFKFFLVIRAIDSVGATLVQVPVIVHIGNSQALCMTHKWTDDKAHTYVSR